jgi:hypothetical protein
MSSRFFEQRSVEVVVRNLPSRGGNPKLALMLMMLLLVWLVLLTGPLMGTEALRAPADN